MRIISGNLERVKFNSLTKRCFYTSLFSILCISPSFGVTNPQIANLINQKQQKLEQLEQCAKKTKGFQIAGISTLGLTAVGIGGNIALSSKNKKLETAITNTQSAITTQEKTLANLNEQIAEKERIANELAQKKANCDAQPGKHWDDATKSCVNDAPVVTPATADAAPQTATPAIQVIDGRIVNSACIAGDLPYNASSGTYIKLAREFTIEKNGWASKKCYASSNSTDVVDCSCAATACNSDELELVQGLCKKKTETANNEEQQETPAEQEQPAEETTVKPEENETPTEEVQEKTVETPAEQPQETRIDVKLDPNKVAIGSQSLLDYGTTNPYLSRTGTNDKCKVNRLGDWCGQFDNYVVNGIYTCSEKYNNEPNDYATYPKAKDQNLKAGEIKGKYCYCKMTSWTPHNGQKQTKNSTSWFFNSIMNNLDDCRTGCGVHCEGLMTGKSEERKKLRGRMFNEF